MRRCFTRALFLFALLIAGDPALAARAPGGASPSSALSSWLRQKLSSSVATASGDASTAMGYNTKASGGVSTAMGYSTEASGNALPDSSPAP